MKRVRYLPPQQTIGICCSVVGAPSSVQVRALAEHEFGTMSFLNVTNSRTRRIIVDEASRRIVMIVGDWRRFPAFIARN